MAAFGLVVIDAYIVFSLVCAIDAKVLAVFLVDEVGVCAFIHFPQEAAVGGTGAFKHHAVTATAAGSQIVAAALLTEQYIAVCARGFSHKDVTVGICVFAVCRNGGGGIVLVAAEQFLVDVEPDVIFGVVLQGGVSAQGGDEQEAAGECLGNEGAGVCCKHDR